MSSLFESVVIRPEVDHM